MRTRVKLLSALLRYSRPVPLTRPSSEVALLDTPLRLGPALLRPIHLGFLACMALNGESATRPGQHKSPMTDKLWLNRLKLRLEGPPQTTLVTKTPAESKIVLDYKFADDEQLRELYRNPWGSVRAGKLMEDLDACAGAVAFQHTEDADPKTRPALVVTASVDKMSMLGDLRLDTNVKLVGAVTWVGRSSMEIQMKIILDPPPPSTPDGKEGGGTNVLVAYFTYVARDAKTGKAVEVNRLSPQTDEERQLFDEAAARDANRKRRRLLHQAPPTHFAPAELNERLAKLLEEGRVLKEMPALADRNSILIETTRLENTIICQPQQRNVYGRIFGGFLMRRAFELAFATCYVFAGSRPIFLEVDYIEFRRPVEIGDLLRFKSCVLYTEPDYVQEPHVHIEVVAYITKPEMKCSQISNTFYFTLTVDPKRDSIPEIRRVLPATEEEARTVLMRYEADHEET